MLNYTGRDFWHEKKFSDSSKEIVGIINAMPFFGQEYGKIWAWRLFYENIFVLLYKSCICQWNFISSFITSIEAQKKSEKFLMKKEFLLLISSFYTPHNFSPKFPENISIDSSAYTYSNHHQPGPARHHLRNLNRKIASHCRIASRFINR